MIRDSGSKSCKRQNFQFKNRRENTSPPAHKLNISLNLL